MITASTALTIFIMNIHFCGADAKPVPHWAKVLIIDYMSKILFVYEVGESCALPLGHTQDCDLKQHQERSQRSQRSQCSQRSQRSSKLKGCSSQKMSISGQQNLVSLSSKCERNASNGCVKEALPPCFPDDGESAAFTVSRCHCQGRSDPKLIRNVEYISNCFREQRATCLKVAEWKKVAKVMDRFFMWTFFIMVFLMSILIIGKAP